MSSKTFWLRVAGSIFGVVAMIHFLRIITNVPVLIGSFALPVWINCMGLIATVFLCYWLWRLSLSNQDQ